MQFTPQEQQQMAFFTIKNLTEQIQNLDNIISEINNQYCIPFDQVQNLIKTKKSLKNLLQEAIDEL